MRKHVKISRQWKSTLRVDIRCRVIFPCVNEIVAMYERPRVNVKVERGLTFTFTHDLRYIASILFTHVKFTWLRIHAKITWQWKSTLRHVTLTGPVYQFIWYQIWMLIIDSVYVLFVNQHLPTSFSFCGNKSKSSGSPYGSSGWITSCWRPGEKKKQARATVAKMKPICYLKHLAFDCLYI